MAFKPRIPPKIFSTYVTCRECSQGTFFETDLDIPNHMLTVLGFLFGMVNAMTYGYMLALTNLLSCSCFGGITSWSVSLRDLRNWLSKTSNERCVQVVTFVEARRLKLLEEIFLAEDFARKETRDIIMTVVERNDLGCSGKCEWDRLERKYNKYGIP